ncbi:MAG: AI-2E family transporter [Coriobacteriia bacterium]|nr:AI-2E family transporter [Coriobacteriia bacterium]
MPKAPTQKQPSGWQRAYYIVWATIGGLLLAGATGWALVYVSGALAPFIVAFLLVVALQAPVAALVRKNVPRGVAVAICFLVSVLVLTLIGFFVAPLASEQLVDFANKAPGILQRASVWIDQTLKQASTIVLPEWVQDSVLSTVKSLSDTLSKMTRSVITGVVATGSWLVSAVFSLVFGSVIAFWVLKDMPKMREEIRILAGEKYGDDIEKLLSTIGRMVGGYVKGQTIVSVVTGLSVGIGLSVLKVPYAAVLGIIMFVCNYIPYAGPAVTAFIAALCGLIVSPWVALGAAVIVVVAVNAIDILVVPRVMSDQVNLHPILVILSLLVGGTLFGVWGMIFSIPVAATGKALFVYYYERWTQRRLATEGGALFKLKLSGIERGQEAEDDPKNDQEAKDAEDGQGAEGGQDAQEAKDAREGAGIQDAQEGAEKEEYAK